MKRDFILIITTTLSTVLHAQINFTEVIGTSFPLCAFASNAFVEGVRDLSLRLQFNSP